MSIQLFDTLCRTTKPLKSADGKSFRFYCCGPTVYGPPHIGNFRTFLLQDVFRRVLEIAQLSPLHVRNLTDVDDKTIRQSQAEGLSLNDFTKKWTVKFHEDCESLNMLKPHHEPAATAHIKQQVVIIQQLIKKEHAYFSPEGSVYYKVSSFKDYGKLAHLDPETLRTQNTTSSEVANLADEYDRESVADFALWKAHKAEDGDNAWDSPWGKGRPGWHIECSAMCKEYLGETCDLHAGGIDLCFPHHENEIAQSEGANDKPFCNHWFHAAHLMVEGAKMSKSLGNLLTLSDIQAKGFSANTLRYLLISAHYRKPLNFTLDGLHAAQSAIHKLEKLVTFLSKASHIDDFHALPDNETEGWGSFSGVWEALCNDLNTPAAIGALFTAAKQLESTQNLPPKQAKIELLALKKALYALGIKLFTEEKNPIEEPQHIHDLAQQRWEAKRNKAFVLADSLRDQIHAEGWKILDHKEGFDLEPLS